MKAALLLTLLLALPTVAFAADQSATSVLVPDVEVIVRAFGAGTYTFNSSGHYNIVTTYPPSLLADGFYKLTGLTVSNTGGQVAFTQGSRRRTPRRRAGRQPKGHPSRFMPRDLARSAATKFRRWRAR